MSSKTKNILKKIGLITLGIGAVGAVGMGGKALYDYAKNDLETIHPTFEVGALGNDGEYVSNDLSLYTKDSFRCDGLQAKLDFDSDISYQFFYYDDLGNFMDKTETYTKGQSFTPLGTNARCVITPTNDEDGKISLKERITYPSQLDIKVSKKQTSKFFNLANKTLLTIRNFNDLIFTYGEYEASSNNWIDNINDNAVTSKQLFEVGNFKSISLGTITNLEVDSFVSFIHEFYVVDGNLVLNKVTKLDKLAVDNENSHTLRFDTKTEYILISCKNINDDLPMNLTESDLADLNSVFIVK